MKSKTTENWATAAKLDYANFFYSNHPNQQPKEYSPALSDHSSLATKSFTFSNDVGQFSDLDDIFDEALVQIANERQYVDFSAFSATNNRQPLPSPKHKNERFSMKNDERRGEYCNGGVVVNDKNRFQQPPLQQKTKQDHHFSSVFDDFAVVPSDGRSFLKNFAANNDEFFGKLKEFEATSADFVKKTEKKYSFSDQCSDKRRNLDGTGSIRFDHSKPSRSYSDSNSDICKTKGEFFSQNSHKLRPIERSYSNMDCSHKNRTLSIAKGTINMDINYDIPCFNGLNGILTESKKPNIDYYHTRNSIYSRTKTQPKHDEQFSHSQVHGHSPNRRIPPAPPAQPPNESKTSAEDSASKLSPSLPHLSLSFSKKAIPIVKNHNPSFVVEAQSSIDDSKQPPVAVLGKIIEAQLTRNSNGQRRTSTNNGQKLQFLIRRSQSLNRPDDKKDDQATINCNPSDQKNRFLMRSDSWNGLKRRNDDLAWDYPNKKEDSSKNRLTPKIGGLVSRTGDRDRIIQEDVFTFDDRNQFQHGSRIISEPKINGWVPKQSCQKNLQHWKDSEMQSRKLITYNLESKSTNNNHQQMNSIYQKSSKDSGDALKSQKFLNDVFFYPDSTSHKTLSSQNASPRLQKKPIGERQNSKYSKDFSRGGKIECYFFVRQSKMEFLKAHDKISRLSPSLVNSLNELAELEKELSSVQSDLMKTSLLYPSQRYSDEDSSKNPPKTHQKYEIAIANYDFTSRNDRELTFFKNDQIQINAQIDECWYEGELNGHCGLITMVAGTSQNDSNDSTCSGTKNLLDIRPSSSKIRSGSSVSKKKPSVRFMVPPEGLIEISLNVSQLCVATYDYRPSRPDELAIRANDIICISEVCPDNWFVGTSLSTGLCGYVPGNYVRMIF